MNPLPSPDLDAIRAVLRQWPIPQPLCNTEKIRSIEVSAQKQHPPRTLMRAAGHAVAVTVLRLFDEAGLARNASRVTVIAGPGNNGGDAVEAAIVLRERGCRVALFLVGDPPTQADAQAAWADWSADAPASIDRADAIAPFLDPRQTDCLIDGLFGIGLNRAITGLAADVVDLMNRSGAPIVAIDTPSGLDGDTGLAVGSGPLVRAAHTVTMIADKLGLWTASGLENRGMLEVHGLGLDEAAHQRPEAWRLSASLVAHCLPQRPVCSHKGLLGDLWVIGGHPGMLGALTLATRAALHTGCGRLFAVPLAFAPLGHDPLYPEIMFRTVESLQNPPRSTVTLIGPGLGQTTLSRWAMKQILQKGEGPCAGLVLDADALNLLATDTELRSMAEAYSGEKILTPHPLEAARLLGIDVPSLSLDRYAAARQLAEKFHAVVVLKGAATVIAAPKETPHVNPTGNPGLSTAGTGDVLAGMIAALWAQHLGLAGIDRPTDAISIQSTAMRSACAAVFVHGAAADVLEVKGLAPMGMSASQLLPALGPIWNELALRGLGRSEYGRR